MKRHRDKTGVQNHSAKLGCSRLARRGDKPDSLSGWRQFTSGIAKGAIMGSPNATDSRLAGLLELVNAGYQKWHGQKLRPTRERRLKALNGQRLSAAGWAFNAVEIFRELQEREVRRHVRIYADVARTKRCPEMLSGALLEDLRRHLQSSIEGSCQHLQGRINIRVMGGVDVTAAPLPGPEEFRQLQSCGLDVINAELRVLEAEYAHICAQRATVAQNQTTGMEAVATPSVSKEPNPGYVHLRPESAGVELTGGNGGGRSVVPSNNLTNDRRLLYINLRRRCKDAKQPVNHDILAKRADSGWNDRTWVKRWTQYDSRATAAHDRKIRRAIQQWLMELEEKSPKSPKSPHS